MRTLAAPKHGELASREHRDEAQVADPRTPFQHDKDRILHSTAFRRLQYKTQVYVIHEGDYYRTRLTHSLEVAQIARGLATHLGADSDLAEAIALAHDLGHPPFGHVGGDVLQVLLGKYGLPFDHNIQSYRIVSQLEERYADFKGLNLTYGTREGILRHCTYFDREEDIKANIPAALRRSVSRFWNTSQPTLEAQIVNIADIIAYATHDTEDALEMGLLSWESFCESLRSHHIRFLQRIVDQQLDEAVGKYKQRNKDANDGIVSKIRNRSLSRLIIDKLIRETVTQTQINLAALDVGSPSWQEVRKTQRLVVALPRMVEQEVTVLVKELLFNQVYREPRVIIMTEKGKRILSTLFESFMGCPDALPLRTQSRLNGGYSSKNIGRRQSKSGQRILAGVVGDYISGMTDKYAMDTYQLLTQAYEKAL